VKQSNHELFRGRNLIIVDSVKTWPADWKGYAVMSALDYLVSNALSRQGLRVMNLCKHDERLSLGYYVSLLAEARGHRVIPSAKTLQDIGSKSSYHDVLEDLQPQIDNSLARIESDTFTLSVYFGENLAQSHNRLAKLLYNAFKCPLMRFNFKRVRGHWKTRSVEHLGLDKLPYNHLEFTRGLLDRLLHKRWKAPHIVKTPRYELAILHNPLEPHPPSNDAALKKFAKAARRLGMRAEFIQPDDYPRLLEYDALFIRETTNLEHHTLRFANKAEREGMVVIDDPDSIRRCCNKVYLTELMQRNRIRIPKTQIFHKQNWETIVDSLLFPCIVKVPNGSFSVGVYKVEDKQDFAERTKALFKHSAVLLVQEFLPTDYDWRIGVLDQEVLYACHYYMSRGHWQIYNHGARRKQDRAGMAQCIPLQQVPKSVKDTALNACRAIGNGLYGVDIKNRDAKTYVIEVNDNPSIDSGVEDALLEDTLYDKIMHSFLNRLELSRNAHRFQENPVASANPGEQNVS